MEQVLVITKQREIDALLRTPAARDMLLAVARPHATEAAGRAPKDTGAGAASIHAEAVLDDGQWAALVSWDQRRFYMYFHEVGSRSLPARPFLVPSF